MKMKNKIYSESSNQKGKPKFPKKAKLQAVSPKMNQDDP